MDEDTVPGMAEAIATRMTDLGLSPTGFEVATGLSSPQCIQVREGVRKGYMHRTRVGVARALRWPLDWYARLLAGEDPATFPDTEHADAPLTPEQRITVLEQSVADLRDYVIALADEVRTQGP